MKRSFVVIILALLFSSCARWQNRVDADGSVIGSTSGDWIVIKQSGGHITDVWKLEDQFVQSEGGSDGWLFIDQTGNPVHVGGDMKAVRINEKKEEIFATYIEYHMEHDSISYQERYAIEKHK